MCMLSCAPTRIIDKSFDKATAFSQGFSGLAVYDPENNKMLYEHNAAKYFTPASNIKLFTFYTGLVVLEDSVPALDYQIKNDSLIFSGTGDPSFLNPDLPESGVYQFLKLRGEKLYYLPPVYPEHHFGPGWAWDDYNSSYSAERTPFPVYANQVVLTPSPDHDLPLILPKFFKDSISLNLLYSEPKRAIDQNIFLIPPSYNKGYRSQHIPFKFSNQVLVAILKDTLDKEVKLLNRTSSTNYNFTTLYSIPTDSMYKRMLEVSDNLIAEQILLLSARKLTDTLKTDIAIRYMKANYLQDLPDEPYWVDGSGLSRYNLVTPRAMVKLLQKIYHIVPEERLFSLLATGGESGTLKDHYASEEPYIFAKTGTLRNNHSLSGYLKAKSGKVLIFSFMNSNYTVPSSQLKTHMEIILRSIYENN